jgi:uncharacterized membrane protein YebE (DUF533 family)
MAKLRAELNKYADALHTQGASGMTLYEIVNRYEENVSAPDLVPFSTEYAHSRTAAQLTAQDTLVEQLVAAAKAVGHPQDHPLHNITRTDTQRYNNANGLYHFGCPNGHRQRTNGT